MIVTSVTSVTRSRTVSPTSRMSPLSHLPRVSHDFSLTATEVRDVTLVTHVPRTSSGGSCER